MLNKSSKERTTTKLSKARPVLILAGTVVVLFCLVGFIDPFQKTYDRADAATSTVASVADVVAKAIAPAPTLNKSDYDKRMLALAHYVAPAVSTSTATSTTATTTPSPWPVKSAPYPLPGALLPFNRIVAYYGNFYSKGMGVLGQYPEAEMLAKLQAEVKVWQAADPTTPVIPAIHYIVVTAQGSAGDGKYRLRMPDSQVDKAIADAEKIHGIVFIDFQVALSNVQTEIPLYEKYLKMPNVHLGIDPEFSMKAGAKPGSVIGTMDAADINWAMTYLAKLVKENNLPPKILVIHRFTVPMVTGYKRIMPLPEVQFVMDMDGWGFAAKKINTYNTVVASQPVQFTGFKLFYKNDLKPPSTRMLTPAEVLKLTPSPIYIQYQ